MRLQHLTMAALIVILGDWVALFGLFLILIGAMLLMLSLIPVAFGVMAFIRWLVYVVESLVAMPFWLAAHAAPEGDSHTSRLAQKGYNNLLFILLFPILALGGFVAATAISSIGLQIGWSALYGAVSGMDDNPWGSAFLWFWYLVALLFSSWIIIVNAYNLVDTAPTAVLNWLSTAEPGLNAFSSGGGNAIGKVTGIIGQKMLHMRGSGRKPKAKPREQRGITNTP